MSIVHYLSYLIMWFRDSFRCFPIGVVFESLLRTIMLNGDVWSPSTVQKDDANRDTMPLNTGASESHPLEVACEIGLEPGECLRRLQGGWSVRLPGVGVGMGMGGACWPCTCACLLVEGSSELAGVEPSLAVNGGVWQCDAPIWLRRVAAASKQGSACEAGGLVH